MTYDACLTHCSLDQSTIRKCADFTVHQVVVTVDIKKLFLRIGVAEKDRHALRFLWVNDTNDQNPVVQLTINNNQNNINNIKDQNPIPKTSAPSSAKEYRPISLLSLIPKLLGTRRCSWHMKSWNCCWNHCYICHDSNKSQGETFKDTMYPCSDLEEISWSGPHSGTRMSQLYTTARS